MLKRLFPVRWLLTLIAAPWFAAGVTFAADVSAPPDVNNRTYGKEQVLAFDIDAATLAKFRAHKGDVIDPKRSPAENMASASTTDWTGQMQKLVSSKKPYVMVVTLSGTAMADGDAVSAWHAGWKNEEGVTRSNPVAGLNKLKAKAGERFMVTVSSAPVSFKEDRSMQPVLGLARARNMQIESVNIQVWSGLPGHSWQQILFSLPVLMLGLTMFVLWWFLRRRV